MKVVKIVGIVFGVLLIVGLIGGYFLQKEMQKFQSKARQQMSKVLLTGVYTGSMATHAEFNFYTSDLKVVGFIPEGELDAKVGFTQPSPNMEPQFGVEINPFFKDTDTMLEAGGANFSYSSKIANIPFMEVAQKYCPDCTASQDGFKVIAFSNIDDDPTLDVWTIDQDKNMVHVVNDLEM